MKIILEGLFKKYGEKEIFRSLSMEIREKERIALMSPSGSGKTTLLRILAGLEQPDQGRILGMEGKKIGMVFQEDRLCKNLTVQANIRMVLPHDVSKEEMAGELEAVGLKGTERQPVCHLSGGMKRRVALVRAFMPCPDILLLDEPFQGLDEERKKQVMAYTRERVGDAILIMATHDIREAEYMGCRIAEVF